MRSLESLLDEIQKSGARLQVDVATARKVPSDLDVVFHVPLIAITVLVVAQLEKARLTTAELSRWVSGVLSEHCFGASDAIRRFQWSVVLRERSATALLFLEAAGLATVSTDEQRTVTVTEQGKKLLRTAAADEDEWGSLVRGLSKAYGAARARGLMLI